MSAKDRKFYIWVKAIHMNKSFRLYTWQNPDWDITKEKRDPSKGLQDWGKDTWDRLQPLYKKLEKKVDTCDFVHCFAEYEHWKQSKIRKLWVLDVPSSVIFKCLDSDIWEKMVQDVLNNIQPNDMSWDKLIVEISEGIRKLSTGNNADITPLVLVPLSRSIQVISNNRFNKGPNYPNAKYEDLPTSECEARRNRKRKYLPTD